MMKVLAVANQKGGVGKTALSVHAAWKLQEAGKRVLFIDLDNQGNASKTLGEYSTGVGASQFFSAGEVQLDRKDGISLVVSDDPLADVERAPAQVLGLFKQHVARLSQQFDYCVIDTAPVLGMKMTGALIAANYVVCPIELEGYSIDGITKMLQTIFGVRERFNPGLSFLGMLPSRVNSHSPRQKDALRQLLDNPKIAQFMVPVKIGNRQAVAEALEEKMPVWKLKKTAARDAGEEMQAALSLLIERMEAL
jgi:chromosome partitioning protein